MESCAVPVTIIKTELQRAQSQPNRAEEQGAVEQSGVQTQQKKENCYRQKFLQLFHYNNVLLNQLVFLRWQGCRSRAFFWFVLMFIVSYLDSERSGHREGI